MSNEKKFFKVRVEVCEDFGRNGNTYGDSPIRVEDGKVTLAWSNFGGLKWWGDSSDVRNDETFAIDEKVCGIVADYLRDKSPEWWNKAFAAAEEKGSFDIPCRLPNRKGFTIRATIDCLDAGEVEYLPEEEYADFVKFLDGEDEE